MIDVRAYDELKDLANNLPNSPGVYIMKDLQKKVIYVGKAKNLRKRVSSYFTKGRDVKTRVLIEKIRFLEHISTSNEYEALILENNLIKQWTPRYNINLKDGKSYPVIRITAEDYPRVFRTRRIIQDGSEYFGPYPDVSRLDIYLELIERLFPLRKCKGTLKKRQSPCLYYHIGRCAAPCAGLVSKEEYGRTIGKIRHLLNGEVDDLVTSLRVEMEEAVEGLRFEKAAELRDAIESIRELTRQQEVVDFLPDTRDYIAYAARDELCSFNVFQMREGKLLGKDLFSMPLVEEIDEALPHFLLQYYSSSVAENLPDTIYVPVDADFSLVVEYFKRERCVDVEIRLPDGDRHASIMRMARENALQDLDRRIRDKRNVEGMEELQEVLELPSLPERIEGFDIAQLSGTHPVASMVSFLSGRPNRKEYRTFHIKTLDGAIDDYGAMREVVARRYTRVLNEGLPIPDLILVDGGKGQVGAAKGVLEALGMSEVPLAGLAKRFEEIYLPDRKDPVILRETSEALRLLQGVRDESHRFATSFNKRLRAKDVRFSLLEAVPGIGEKRSRKLLEVYDTLEGILGAGASRVSEECGIPLEKAEELLAFLRNKEREREREP